MNQMISRLSIFPIIAVSVLFGASELRAADIPLPTIPNATFNVTRYGAVGDGKTLNTAAIQKAIDACATAGGGTVLVPAGNFVFGPITLASQVNLHWSRARPCLSAMT